MHGSSKQSEVIVRYTTATSAFNGHPRLIIPPSRPGPCCATQMRVVSEASSGDGTPHAYKQCEVCGFTVFFFPEGEPDGPR